ncbi:MAG: transcriptional regulator [Burkholderiaceae bacterium]|uniref:transcriptional regulator n=1 Tax=Hydrogenophaga sp. TaxID=1904254 RepID=UPI002772F014|nr:transcriptional regulator [Hydrogenophaga sp.]MDP2065066.1 transcriptional regulator [Burkholderiaceae bacterium]MDZ4144130.1 transcriptional regulator [Burkholderiales bacterium]MDZ4396269.1 transcriptional regulator [Hydrogenophaga sp.]
MLTIVETPLFQSLWPDYWGEEERGEFAVWLAHTPEAGDVVPGSGGVRKVRWTRKGAGKRGGVRVVYFNRLANGEIWLLLIYAKSARDNVPAHVLKRLKQEIEDAHD